MKLICELFEETSFHKGFVFFIFEKKIKILTSFTDVNIRYNIVSHDWENLFYPFNPLVFIINNLKKSQLWMWNMLSREYTFLVDHTQY